MLKLKLQYFDHLLERANLLEKTPDAGEDWRQEEKGMMEDKMVEWHHRLDEHEFGQGPGVGGGQRSLVCFKESDTIELNWSYSHFIDEVTESEKLITDSEVL